MVHIVIIGLGFGGASTLQALSKFENVELTVVDPRERFILLKMSTLRGATKEGGWIDRALIPTEKLFDKAKFIQATAVSIDDAGKTVTLSNGETLQYDGLVIASGSRNFSPAEPSVDVTSKEETKQYWKKIHDLYASAKSILIVGSGPVALELAGELYDHFPEKKVTIVTKSKHVLAGKTPLRKSGVEAVAKDLGKLGVTLIYEDEVTSETFPLNLATAFPVIYTPTGVTLRSGKKLESDLLVYCVGSQLRTEFVPSKFLDEKTKEILVDPKTLQVQGSDVIYAVGDVAKTESTKLGYFAQTDAPIVAKNLMRTLQKKKPTYKVSRMAVMFVPLGKSHGRSILPFMTLGPVTTGFLKGKQLLTNLYWPTFAPKVPRPKAE